MKITKIKKLSNDKYKIEFDNHDKLITYDKVILNNNLLFDKEVDNKKLNDLIIESDYYSNYNKVVKYINIKIRSEFEINKYLDKIIVNEKDKKNIIKELKKQNLINDKNFVKSFISDKIRLSTMGPNKIRQELLKHEINLNLINEELNNYGNEDIREKLRKLIIKKIRLNNKYSNYILKQKLLNYFLELGYDNEDILEIINENLSSNDLSIKKEYELQKKKLSKKYSGEQLDFYLCQKLYQKGFTREEIEKISG